MTKFSRGLATIVLAATLALPLAALAKSSNDINTNAHVRQSTKAGTVASISGNSITLSGKDGVTYTVDATNAKLVRHYGATLQLTDIQTGDKLTVRGTISGTSITATMIRDESLQARSGTFVGTVSALSGSGFTLQSKARGTQTITTTSTTVFKRGSQTATLADVTVGQTVTVSGVWDRTNSNVTANRVTIKIAWLNINGTFQSATGNVLTVLSNKGVTYTFDATKARIVYRNGHVGSVAMLQANDKVMVQGQVTSGSNNGTASVVRDLSQSFKKTNSTSNSNQ